MSESAPVVGARRAEAVHGLDGAGVNIAVIDTGIDYTHAAFGGPGVRAAYDAATRSLTHYTETWGTDGTRLFPSDSVIGGHDLVGVNYAAPGDCRRDDPAECLPEPDLDPIEDPPELARGGSASGHGTHVASIAAGRAEQGGLRGVAPAARLVALKIYGVALAGSEMVPAAIEWCTRVNLGLAVPGVAPERIDVINLSVGELYPGPGLAAVDEAVESAIATGALVVGAAGNDAARPFSILSPGSSDGALSVASAQHGPLEAELIVEEPDATLAVSAVEALFGTPLADRPAVTGALAEGGRACGADGVRWPRGAIVLAERGGCPDPQKAIVASEHGAGALLLFDPKGAPPTRLSGDPADVRVPVLMVERSDAVRWRERLAAGERVTITLDPATLDGDRGASLFTARGPAADGRLKPDIAAPGNRILAADSGTGTGLRRIPGTSMSAPHVSGGAALVLQRARRGGLEMGPRDVAALLKSTARSPVGLGGPTGEAVTRVGAGLLDVSRAGRADILVRSGALAEIDLGTHSFAQVHDGVTRTLHIRNLTDRDRTVRVSLEQSPEGIDIELPTDPIELGPSEERVVQLVARHGIDSVGDRPQDVQSLRAEELGPMESEGWLMVEPAPEAAEGVTDTQLTASPIRHALPIYSMTWRSSSIGIEPDAGGMMVSNPAEVTGTLEAHWALLARSSPNFGEPVRIGSRWLTRDDGDVWLELAIARRDAMAMTWLARPAAYFDTDADGAIDRVATLTSDPRKERFEPYPQTEFAQLEIRTWGAEAGQPGGLTDRVLQPFDVFGQVTVLRMPADALGLDVTDPAAAPALTMWVDAHRWGHSEIALGPGAVTLPQYRVPPGRPLADGPTRWTIAPAEALRIPAPSLASAPPLLFLKRTNDPHRRWSGSQIVGGARVYLPNLGR